MPKYRVTLYYHGSATYDVEADNETAACAEAKRLNDLEPEAEFREKLILDLDDWMVEEDKEE